MQPSLSSSTRRPTVYRFCLCLCCSYLFCLVAGLSGSAVRAQNLPRQLSVSPTELTAGEIVSVQGSGLPPGSQVTAQLTAPGGVVSRESVRVGEGGRFLLETPLDTVGSYQLVVRGQGLDETRVLAVRAADAQITPNQAAPKQSTPVQSPPNQSAPKRSTQATPQPSPATAEVVAAGTAPPTVSLTEGGLQASRGGALSWQLTFPAGSGATTEPLVVGEQLYVGHGNSVLRLKPQTGDILERAIVSGPVERLDRVDDTTLAVTVRHAKRLLERFTLRAGRLQEPVRFGGAPATFSYLRAEANVRDPAARLKRDPTNPWLYLALGLGASGSEAAAHFTEAIETATTFYDLAGLATVLEARGERALAADTFDAAMRDFAARGYDPRLLTNAGLEAAYTFPLTPLRAALDRNDDLSAGFWAERLVLAAPDVPGADAALRDYAALLRAVGSAEDADRERRADRSTPAPDLPKHVAMTLGRSGWGLALALLGAFGASQLTLFAKYARARRADRGEGGRAPWLFAVRYATLSEKVVLLLLLAAALGCSALAGWQGATHPLPPAVTSGTLLSRPAQVFETDLSGPGGAFIRGYAAQTAGDEAAAQILTRAGDYAPALNNLGALTGDAELYRQALALEPTLAAARYNLGDTSSQRALLPFQARYQPGPALAVPTARDLQNATTGDWQTALARAFTAPQLLNAPPAALATTLTLVLWRGAQLAFLLVALTTAVFVFVPRPRSVHGAARPWVYELLALFVPGSGLADDAWGIFLLVPWAVFGSGALSVHFGWGIALGLTPGTLYLILAGIYLLNTVAVVIEWQSHRSRRRVRLRRAGTR